MDESSYAARWLYAVLNGDATITAQATGGVWEEPAPQGRPFPLLVFSLLSAIEVETSDKTRIYVDSLWLVKAVTEGHSYGAAEVIASQVDALLHRADGVVTGATIYSAGREGIVRYAETSEGVSYRHLGGQYRIQIQTT